MGHRARLECPLVPVLDKIGFRRDHSVSDERSELVYMVRDA
jgi:hypothetical protein